MDHTPWENNLLTVIYLICLTLMIPFTFRKNLAMKQKWVGFSKVNGWGMISPQPTSLSNQNTVFKKNYAKIATLASRKRTNNNQKK